ncbi:hypothetical protein LCGC14_2896440 [marine sediment metagenome]|uniref:Uncharacterized protein n=1 Tax=marine sediment metagenome TaxID=412755 RepID=A0A0F8XW36_9ZZZZ
MEGYLGEEELESYAGTPYEGFGPKDWALEHLEQYGGIDGEHHKIWVIDQCIRILKGTPVKLRLARWENGLKEYRFSTGNPSDEYTEWVKELKAEGYRHDEGIAP